MNPLVAAALWMIGAITSFTAMAISGRQISETFDTFEIMTYRSLIGIAIVVTIITLQNRWSEVNTNRIGLHTIRNLAHFTGQNLWFYAIPLIPLAQLFALEFTTPLWVLLLSPLILRERLTAIGILSALLGFIGILIVAQPGTSDFSFGLIPAALCAVFFALTAIFTRQLTQTQSIACILFYLTTMQAVFGIVMAGWDGDVVAPWSPGWPYLIVIGFAGLMAHFCLTKALSLAPASVVMPIDFVRLPVIAVVGMLLYNEPLDALIFVGAILIFAANYLNITKGQRS